jgi:alkylation response protein AidB-like acyl-CoA dehydrogenase
LPAEVAEAFLPAYCAGSTIGAMVLTEAGGGSDLGRVRLKAFQDDEGAWRLRGTKQFISNGNGEVLLVLARSEEGSDGMFGLSLFACNGENVTVSRLEEKMGLHGSPTCELVFDDAKAHLVGKRRSGLLHVLHILNQARFSVAAQGLGIAEAAYQVASEYAYEREAFGDTIYKLPAVADMLVDIRTTIEACRALTYAGCQWLVRRNRLEVEIERARASGEPVADLKARFKVAAANVDFLSPAVKYFVTEEQTVWPMRRNRFTAGWATWLRCHWNAW